MNTTINQLKTSLSEKFARPFESWMLIGFLSASMGRAYRAIKEMDETKYDHCQILRITTQDGMKYNILHESDSKGCNPASRGLSSTSGVSATDLASASSTNSRCPQSGSVEAAPLKQEGNIPRTTDLLIEMYNNALFLLETFHPEFAGEYQYLDERSDEFKDAECNLSAQEAMEKLCFSQVPK